MKRYAATFFSALAIILSLSCGPWELAKQSGDADSSYGYFNKEKNSAHQSPSGNLWNQPKAYQDSVEEKANEILHGRTAARVSFEDRTRELVAHAERLIKNNQEEGAVLDQRWYGLKYFGKHQELIFAAVNVMFFGGLEYDVRNHLGDRYTSIDPVEENQDSGDIRLYIGKRKEGNYDFIIIGQNGREVALKTIIRLLYLTKFVDDKTKQKYRDKLASFTQSLQVLLSSVSPREEFITFFNRYGIDRPDAVIIGFRGDVRSLMKDEGISDPELYTDESLRVNWYPDANGKRVLLVSIDKNRIFASRSGELIEAIFAISANTLPSITLLCSCGAIDAPEMVGKIVTPTSVMKGESFPASVNKGILVHIIRNKAADEAATKTAAVSVESVVVETTKWVTTMKAHGVNTVDQELFPIVNAINSSAYAAKVDVFAGTLVTDNVSSNAQNNDMTLEHAEATIAATVNIRREFFSKVLKTLGILKKETRGMPRRSQSPEIRPSSFAGRSDCYSTATHTKCAALRIVDAEELASQLSAEAVIQSTLELMKKTASTVCFDCLGRIAAYGRIDQKSHDRELCLC
ncbi:MAG TPA: hypothetical protein VIL52_02440 [Bacteroidota bacterium]